MHDGKLTQLVPPKSYLEPIMSHGQATGDRRCTCNFYFIVFRNSLPTSDESCMHDNDDGTEHDGRLGTQYHIVDFLHRFWSHSTQSVCRSVLMYSHENS